MKIQPRLGTLSTTLVTLLSAGALTASAQAPSDALRNAHNDLNGTARIQAMGGAGGALGADPSAILINPAGAAMYGRSIISFGFEWKRKQIDVGTNGDALTPRIGFNSSRSDFNNFSFVSSRSYLSDLDWTLNWGITYNKDYSYTNRYAMKLVGPQHSLGSYIANRANRGGVAPKDLYDDVNGSGYNPRFQPLDQLVVLGLNSEVIGGANSENDANFIPGTWVWENDIRGGRQLFLNPSQSQLNVLQSGQRRTTALHFATSYLDRFYIGASAAISSLSFSHNSEYSEKYGYQVTPETSVQMDVMQRNTLESKGRLYSLNVGALVAIGNVARVGISYMLPQYGTMTDYYRSQMAFEYRKDGPNVPKEDKVQKYQYSTDNDLLESSYSTLVPGKLTLSALVFLSRYGMITYDFSYRNLGGSRFYFDSGDSFDSGDNGINQFVREDLGAQFGHHIGLELRPIKWLSLRGGYSYTTSGMRAEQLRREPEQGMDYEYMPSGTITDFVIPQGYSTISGGVGLSLGKSTVLDLALVNGIRHQRVYAYPGAGAGKNNYGTYPEVLVKGGKTTQNELRVVSTLTFKF